MLNNKIILRRLYSTMKLPFYLLLALLFIQTAVIAQSTKEERQQDREDHDVRNKITMGFKLGLNYANGFDWSSAKFVANSFVGLATGTFISIPLSTTIGLQPELLFSQKGFRSDGLLNGQSYSVTRTTNYFDLPLQVAFKPLKGITILVGPQYTYLIRQTDDFKSGPYTTQQALAFEQATVKRNTVSLLVGVDLTLRHLVLSTKAGMDLHQNIGDGPPQTQRYNYLWLQACVGYRFYNNR